MLYWICKVSYLGIHIPGLTPELLRSPDNIGFTEPARENFQKTFLICDTVDPENTKAKPLFFPDIIIFSQYLVDLF